MSKINTRRDVLVENVTQFFEYLSHVHRMFSGASHNGLLFIKPLEKDYKYFFTNFSDLQQEVMPIFKRFNSTFINTFKALKNIFAPFI